MGREATKASGNPWYEARKKAAEYDDRLCSREGAAERLGMSVSAVADAELGLSKCMPVDKAVLMADLYRAPHLLNHYCLHECPIGCRHSLSDEEKLCTECDSESCVFNPHGVCLAPFVTGHAPALCDEGCGDYCYKEV